MLTLTLGISLVEGQEIRGGNATLVGLWVLVVLTFLWALYAVVAHFRRPANDEASRVSITSHGQSGGVTAGTVNITNRDPQPTLSLRKIFANQLNADGRYHTKYEADITSAYAVQSLAVRAHAPSIQKVALYPTGAGPAVNVWSREGEGGIAEAGIGTVRSPMDVDVFTTRPEDGIQFDWQTS